MDRVRWEVNKEQARVLLCGINTYESEYQGTNVLNEEEQMLINELRLKLDWILIRLSS